MPRSIPLKLSLTIAAIVLIIAGTIAYSVVENLNLLDSLYFLTITVTTVGYGDIYPTTVAGRIITLLLVPLGLLLVFGIGITLFVERLDDLVLTGGLSKIEDKVESLEDHYIICGHGSLGSEVTGTLQRMGADVVVVDKNADKLRGLEKDGVLYIVGDAQEEETLKKAGIEKAKCIISTFSDDTQNVYLILEVRDIHPDITIISAASGREASRRMYLAGASRVVSPQILAGDILAKSAMNPQIYQLMSDMMLAETGGETITQVVVSSGSSLHGKNLTEFRDMGISARVILIRQDETTILSPSGEFELEPDMVLVAVGEAEDIEKLDKLSSA